MLRICALSFALAAAPAWANIPLEKIQVFAEVFERVRSSYVEEVTDEALLDAAIRGMLSDLDPHSSYLPPSSFDNLREATSGEFGGLGIEVAAENGAILVVSPIDDTPAFDAGILAGDLIVEIDGTDVRGMDLGQAIEKLRGPKGSSVELVIERRGERIDFSLERALIAVKSVRSTELEDGFGWVRISQFSDNTGDETRDALVALSEQSELKGVVLDLRNNPGGVLGAAVGVVDTFVEQGVIVSTETRDATQSISFNAAAQANDFLDLPLVVLINEGSASASEIVAGAVQDLRRGVVMGTQSFGKGSVQTLLPMTDGSALKLTTALYYTPDGRSIQNSGITPDIRVAQGTLTEEVSSNVFRESDLAGRLENPTGDGANNDEINPVLARDFQLREALNMLKGLSLVQ